MERAARVIKNKNVSGELLSDDEIFRAVWAEAVGKTIAAHASPGRVVRTTLIVEVEDAIWQKQLYALGSQILARLAKLTGKVGITDIEFRVAIPRRQPARVGSLRRENETAVCSDDEADRISDPVLRKVYRLSRKKATA